MATRSVIAILQDNGYHSVYCHWDGYLEHNGVILDEFYRDPQKVLELIQHGDISTLGAEIGQQHDFDNYDRAYRKVRDTHVAAECTFYNRDRGEVDVTSVRSEDFSQFLERVESCTAEFYYVMRDGQWYCGAVYDTMGVEKNKLVLLADSLQTIHAAEDA